MRTLNKNETTLIDIQKLIELFVSNCYFLWDNVIWNLLNSGPVGLSVMVVLLESPLQNLQKHNWFWRLSLHLNNSQFGSRNNATEFLNVLNSQDLQIQYNIEYENDNKELNFLDVTIRNNWNHSYDFAVCDFTVYHSLRQDVIKRIWYVGIGQNCFLIVSQVLTN